MKKKPPTLGTMSMRAPFSGPQVMAVDQPAGTVKIRLAFDQKLGPPLFVGTLPAQQLGLPTASEQARYALWVETGENTCVLLVDVDWSAAPDDDWLVYLVYGQPPEVEGNEFGEFVYSSTFQDLRSAAARWFHANGEMVTNPDTVEALVRSVRAAESDDLIGSRHTTLRLPRLSERPRNPYKPVDLLGGLLAGTPDLAVSAISAISALEQPDSLPTRFLLTSCQYPGGMLDQATRLAQTVSPCERTLSIVDRFNQSDATRPDFILLLGDQVYVDATAGLADPKLTDGRHVDPYIQWESGPYARNVMRTSRFHAMVDDHELADNWGPVSSEAESLQDDGTPGDAAAYNQQLKALGLRAYRLYQNERSNSDARAPDTDALHGPVGPAHQPKLVFMANTRTERQRRDSIRIEQARIMSDTQWSDMMQWLQGAPQDAWRFLASPSMVLPRRKKACGATPASAQFSDAWDGYPASLVALLAAICDLGLNKLVLLSGDEHLANISRITLCRAATPDAPRMETVIHSIHAPAMYAPYPFANAKADDFSQRSFSFSWPPTANGQTGGASSPYSCQVDTWFPEMGDGFVSIDSPGASAEDQRLKVRLVYSTPDKACTPMPDWLKDATSLRVTVEQPST